MVVSLIATFCFLAATTLGLALTRMAIVRAKGDGCVHLADSDAVMIERQEIAARRLSLVDGWGKALTILAVLCGIAAYIVWWISA